MEFFFRNHGRNGIGRPLLHAFRDLSGTDSQRPFKDSGENQNVIDLIGKIASACADHSRPACLCFLRHDFRHRVCHGKNNAVIHSGNHFLRYHIGPGNAHKSISPLHGIGQQTFFVVDITNAGDFLLTAVQTFISFADDTIFITEDDIAKAHGDQQLANGDACCPGAVDDNAHFSHLFPCYLHGIQHRRRNHDGCAMLVIMENRNIADLFQSALNFKASGGRNILQIDAAEAFGNQINGIDDGIHILGIDAQGKGIHIAKFFEQYALPFHHRHARRRADIPQPQHRCAVCDDCHQIGAACQPKGLLIVLFNDTAGFRHAGRIKQGKILSGFHRLSGNHFDFPIHFIMQL